MFIDACRQNWSWSELDFIRFSKINEYLPWLKCEVKFLHLHAATEKDWHRRSDHAVMSIDKLARTEIDPSLTLLRVKWVLAMTEMRSEVWWRHVFTITCSRHAATEEDWQRRLFTDTWPELKADPSLTSLICLTEVSPLYVHAATGFTMRLVCLRGNWSCCY